MEKKLDKLDGKVTNMESKLSNTKTEIEKNQRECVKRNECLNKDMDNRFMSFRKANEIIVNGIPADYDKPLEDVYELISSSIGYSAEQSGKSQSLQLLVFFVFLAEIIQ